MLRNLMKIKRLADRVFTDGGKDAIKRPRRTLSLCSVWVTVQILPRIVSTTQSTAREKQSLCKENENFHFLKKYLFQLVCGKRISRQPELLHTLETLLQKKKDLFYL